MFTCKLCAKKIQSGGGLSRHVLSHTKEKPHKCLICKATFGVKSNLKQHVKTVHDGVKHMKNKKTPCGFKTKSQISLELHVRRVQSNEKLFPCKSPGCNFLCKSKKYLNIHTSRAHSDEKPFKCSICDFRAKVQCDITMHQRTHMKTKPFKCQVPNCDFATIRKSQVKRHFDCKHRKKDIRCAKPGCHYSCSSMILLKHHLEGHEKPMFNCPGDECHFSTRSKNYLLKHISRFHDEIQSSALLGPRKFDLEIASVAGVMETLQCCVPNCGYQTKFRQHFERHGITHKNEGKWQHVCSFCFSRFSELQALQCHIRRHIREKPHSCSFCKYTFVSVRALKSHTANIHNVRVNPRGKVQEVRKCRTCGRNCWSYSELVLHSMSHLQAVVVLEKLKLQTL